MSSKAAQLLKKVLDLLPLDGSKTKFGAILAIVGLLRFYIPGIDLLQVVSDIAKDPTRAGIIAVLVGVLHKFLKVKYPDVKI